MEENVKNEAVELKNAIDSSIEAKANEVASASAEALEAKATEINESIEKATAGLKAENELLQKQIDEVKMEAKNFNIGAPKRSEFQEQMRSKADEIAEMKRKGEGKVTLDLKTFSGSAGAASAPYGDERVGQIKYDPNFQNRLRNNLMTGSTSQTGAIRHNFETAETDNSGPKGKGVAATDSQSTITDVHTPIITLFNHYSIANEWLDDVDMVESYLSTRLMGNLMDVEDTQLLNGSGTGNNYNGLNTGGRTFADAAAIQAYVGGLAGDFSSTNESNLYDVLSAAKAGLANTNFMADTVILNPIDAVRLTLIKASTREYVLSQTVTPSGAPQYFFNGMKVVETPAQSQGTFTVLDSKCAQYWMREGTSIEFGLNDDDFASNSVSVRAIIRGAQTIYKSNGIITDAFADWQTALDA